MKTFDFVIKVTFFHGMPSKYASLGGFTYQEAFSVFNELKFKYANDNFPFKEIRMEVLLDKEFQVVNYICNQFIEDED